jgi:hypothetical protein
MAFLQVMIDHVFTPEKENDSSSTTQKDMLDTIINETNEDEESSTRGFVYDTNDKYSVENSPQNFIS